MADKSHSGLSRQCRLLSINRSWFYYKPRLISTDDLEMMKRIDTEYMKRPTSGSRTIRDVLARQGHKVNRKRIQRLMRLMGIEMIYPKPKTSKPHPEHRVYPYLLRGLDIDRPDRVWSAIARYGCPEIVNPDQGCQFTSTPFTNVLKDDGIKISMDGRGRFLDTIFIERLWWTVTYQYLHLHSCESGLDMQKGLKKWFAFYNHQRGYQSLKR